MVDSPDTDLREPWIEPDITEMSAQDSESGTTGKNDHASGNSYHQTS